MSSAGAGRWAAAWQSGQSDSKVWRCCLHIAPVFAFPRQTNGKSAWKKDLIQKVKQGFIKSIFIHIRSALRVCGTEAQRKRNKNEIIVLKVSLAVFLWCFLNFKSLTFYGFYICGPNIAPSNTQQLNQQRITAYNICFNYRILIFKVSVD